MTDEPLEGENQALAHEALPKIGDLLAGKYRIEKVVGEGGMGVVFAARNEAIDQLVAVKILLAGAAKGEGAVERFVREAQAAARLQSEHVARVFDAGTLENQTPFIVMEYLEGCDLEELLKIGGGALAIVDACDYILQALAAIAQAHAAGIIHRDLKPANLFLALRPDGSNAIKILDFGISKQTASTTREKALTGRAVLGSPAYMPPEQLRNAKGVDFRADIWSLGIVLYELLTGVTPFDAEGVGEIFAAILEKEPPSLCARRPEIPAALEAVVFAALQRRPEDRWQDVGEFAHALAQFGSGRWTQLVETIDSTLARGLLRSSETPEVRLLGETATAAALKAAAYDRPSAMGLMRAQAAGAATVAEEPSQVAFTRQPMGSMPDGAISAPKAAARRWRTWLVAAATALGILGGTAIFMRGYLSPRIPRPIVGVPTPQAVTALAQGNPANAPAPPETGVPANLSVDAGAKPVASVSAGGTRSGPRRGQPRSPAPSGSAPRPKFLNSRE